ncbi:uncharacterized protein LOC101854607 [Aplysia californica]|uniref:Uncharacterized protein LOC101854607 n=1 Tax=Aplysia californica TaxID=6500 RepID=A0ABM0K6Y6_APLCA|nr:uncharacterized protein LOC101854607 [Aplysia californica]
MLLFRIVRRNFTPKTFILLTVLLVGLMWANYRLGGHTLSSGTGGGGGGGGGGHARHVVQPVYRDNATSEVATTLRDVGGWKVGQTCMLPRLEVQDPVMMKFWKEFKPVKCPPQPRDWVHVENGTHQVLPRRDIFGDEELRDFLTQIHASGHLNHTVLFLFGDHGARYSKVRATWSGKMEERLPYMGIR